MIEKIWWWEMITNGLKSPNNLYLEAKNQKWADMEATYITLLCHIKCNIILVCWLILRDDNAVLISLITKKMYIEQLWRLTYMLFYLQNVLNFHSI